MIRDIKSKIKPEETETVIRVMRKRRDGNVLLELGKLTKDAQAFAEEVGDKIGDAGMVKSLILRVTLELIDLDCLTAKEDV